MIGRLERFRRLAMATGAALVLGSCAHMVMLRDPLTASEHNDLGVAYESSGQPGLAAVEYQKSLKLDPHQGRAWVNLGNVQGAEGLWRDAEKSYRRALRVTPTDSDAMNNLAVALLRQGRNREEARSLAAHAVSGGGDRDSVYRETRAEVDLWNR